MMIKNEIIGRGVPEGKNRFAISHFRLKTPRILIIIKKELERKKVTINELVSVKANEASPLRFAIRIKLNR